MKLGFQLHPAALAAILLAAAACDSTAPGPPRPAAVVLDPDSLTLVNDSTHPLGATARDARGAVLAGVELAWMSDDTSVASVDATGRVTSRGAGSTVVRASPRGADGAAVSGSVRVRVLRPTGV